MSEYMIRRKGKKVPYKEQTCFFLADYGKPVGEDSDAGCLSEEEVYRYDD